MAVAERIRQYAQRLPERLQTEVLDFVEFLLAKAEREGAAQDEQEWTRLSLSRATWGMEDEEGAAYTLSGLKEPFS